MTGDRLSGADIKAIKVPAARERLPAVFGPDR